MENKLVEQRLSQHLLAANAALADDALKKSVVALADRISTCFRQGGKVIFMGNGGSAAEAQHMAAEFLGKYMKERRALPAIAITANSSTLTAIANDYDYSRVFSRQLEALADKKDVVVAYSTSGSSKNVVAALKFARSTGAFTAAFVGTKKCALESEADLCIKAPGDSTPRIQEMHTLLSHIVCELVETALASEGRI